MYRLREAVSADLPDILRIYNDAVIHLVATFDLEVQTLEQRIDWFKKYGGCFPLIVAESDSRVVGYGCLSAYRDKPAYSRTSEVSLYIDPDYRGKGIGSLLLGELIVRAKQLGYHTILAGITGGNETSVKLHEKYGFEHVGCLKEVGYKFGEWRDVHFYQLILA